MFVGQIMIIYFVMSDTKLIHYFPQIFLKFKQ